MEEATDQLARHLLPLEAMARCIDYGIKVYPVPITQGGRWPKCTITVEKHGVLHKGDMTYDQKNGDLSKKVWELYEFYYKQIEGKI